MRLWASFPPSPTVQQTCEVLILMFSSPTPPSVPPFFSWPPAPIPPQTDVCLTGAGQRLTCGSRVRLARTMWISWSVKTQHLEAHHLESASRIDTDYGSRDRSTAMPRPTNSYTQPPEDFNCGPQAKMNIRQTIHSMMLGPFQPRRKTPPAVHGFYHSNREANEAHSFGQLKSKCVGPGGAVTLDPLINSIFHDTTKLQLRLTGFGWMYELRRSIRAPFRDSRTKAVPTAAQQPPPGDSVSASICEVLSLTATRE
ncbi:hypothetical protein QBC34DRAFT_175880 [Podospora aff. communis PSN243]|uniref:Uncharacterized protein n=1 Tax=Podospora aff. communis PSN243 TaxID=3040156 RepID=A0AAV9H310_9PEZI|nr:hypothetical protein QBC34DRAFT_175880 [Podospora aff. communis PSN243]